MTAYITGWGHTALGKLAAMQLSRTVGDTQVPHGGLGAVFNMGGSGVVSILSMLEAAATLKP